jgi:diguanylate cyclase (GGDEF)-like protein
MLAFAFYTLCALVIGFGTWHGLYPPLPLAVYTIGYLAVSVIFIAAIQHGWNLRFKDPSMTEAQIACSAVLCSYILIYAGPFRGVFMFAYVIGLMFGGTQLSVKQLVRLAFIPVTLFPIASLIAARLDPAAADWRVEFVHWISLCVILAFTAMLTGNLSRLRARLRASNAELETALAKLTDMAVHDELTGLYNRRYLLDMLRREKARADRSGGTFCVCVLDIDHFKRINDTYGHGQGDIVLRSFARLAAQDLRAVDLLGRWGGEEFLLLLPETSSDLAEKCPQRIQTELADTSFDGLESDFRITVSAGIAQYCRGMGIDELIDQADRAMYAAKHAGRNRIVKAEAQSSAQWSV